jgi:hypothetical protein
MRYAPFAKLYIAGHYYDSRAPFIFTREDAKQAEFAITYVADISCDIDGPVASTFEPPPLPIRFMGIWLLRRKRWGMIILKLLG